MIAAIEREKPDRVFHLGDYAGDARELAYIYPSLPVCWVRGNNDFDPDVPWETAVSIGQTRIFLTHGHRERVYMLSGGMVAQRAREEGCALAFYGHTHRMELAWDSGVLVCNPGSISLPRGGPESYARLTIEDGCPCGLALLDEDGGLLRMEKMKG